MTRLREPSEEHLRAGEHEPLHRSISRIAEPSEVIG